MYNCTEADMDIYTERTIFTISVGVIVRPLTTGVTNTTKEDKYLKPAST